MLDRLSPAVLLRRLPPQQGALANVRGALSAQAVARRERHDLAVVHARANGPAAWPALGVPDGPLHAVHLSTDDADLVATLAGYCLEGLADGDVCVVAVTPAHLAGLRARIALAGLARVADRLLLVVDADEVLTRVLPEGRPVAELFQREVGGTLRRLVERGHRVRALGETGGLRAAAGDLAGALELEQLWDGLRTELGFPSLCAYGSPLDDRFRGQLLAGHTHLATVPR